MESEELTGSPARERARATGERAYASAERLYQAAIRPDRPLYPETGKQPWLAALLSALLPGTGQLYNRQLVRAGILFLCWSGTGLLLLVLWLLERSFHLGARVPELVYTFRVLWACLWLFGVVDAYRMAVALRAGKLVVRYGFLRQLAHGAAGFVPFVGAAVPGETVRPEELDRDLGTAAREIARDRLLEWAVVRTLRYVCLATGIILIVAGIATGIRPLISFGGLALAAGILLFLA